MTFPNLPGNHNAQIRANLERALQELAYEAAGELFTDAWHLCRDMEKMLTKKYHENDYSNSKFRSTI